MSKSPKDHSGLAVVAASGLTAAASFDSVGLLARAGLLTASAGAVDVAVAIGRASWLARRPGWQRKQLEVGRRWLRLVVLPPFCSADAQ